MLASRQGHQGYEGRGSERTWLVGILKHKIIDHYRRISGTPEIAPGDFNLDDEYDPFEKTGQWTGHWRADLAPTEWQLDASTILESKEFWETRPLSIRTPAKKSDGFHFERDRWPMFRKNM